MTFFSGDTESVGSWGEDHRGAVLFSLHDVTGAHCQHGLLQMTLTLVHLAEVVLLRFPTVESLFFSWSLLTLYSLEGCHTSPHFRFLRAGQLNILFGIILRGDHLLSPT